MYRIVEEDGAGRRRAVAEFDSAYAGAAALRSAMLRTRAKAAHWSLVDASGRVLAEPQDVLDSLAQDSTRERGAEGSSRRLSGSDEPGLFFPPA